MRMWMVDPKIMCRKHLLGEHVELHMFVGTIKKEKELRGYVENRLVQFFDIEKRHAELVVEMERRGMKHNSPLEMDVYDYAHLRHLANKYYSSGWVAEISR